ncbi:MAG: isocitrate lyase/phosphoenolpyruvate mutase family protein [Chloroflexota bacterium]|nr:isocitrate lyase/phosphoenolpyruvate mutase family protein [Chloroflexota bacterium]
MTLQYKTTPGERLRKLHQLIEQKGFVRIIEAHNGLSALVGEMVRVEQDGQVVEYDGFWESSLTDAAAKGLPDAEIVGNPSRLHTIDEILNVTSKPMIVDGDTGGAATQFEYFVCSLERMGVSAVIIEDKVFPKRNSLDASARQTLENPDAFAQKIARGRAARVTDGFAVIARIESLIAGLGIEDAFMRARKYIEAGVDGIMIHSKSDSPDGILAFADAYDEFCRQFDRRPVLVCVPTTYNLITDVELAHRGFNVIIHANHLLRSSYKAMLQTAEVILSNDRGFEAEPLCASVPAVFAQVGFDRVKAKDQEYSKTQRLSVIIPAAGQDPVFAQTPKSLIEIAGKPVLRHQLDSIRKIGIGQVVVIRGYEGEQFDEFSDESNLVLHDNDQYAKKHSLYSLFCAEEQMESGFVLVYSDILFNEDILRRLVATEADIVLAVDNSYRYHRHEVDKRLDLVVSHGKHARHYRSLHPMKRTAITQVGKNINVEKADYEFTGIAYFSEEGARILRKVYHDCLATVDGPFHEADSLAQAGVTDLLQEVIDRGFAVHGLEIFQGWIEVHKKEDVDIAAAELSSDEFGG